MKAPHICFVTTGDIVSIATAKRALGLANHLVDLGWRVSILMEDADENHHRVEMECGPQVQVCYFPWMSGRKEQRWKTQKIRELDPDVLYLCAFVGRNIVASRHRSIKLVEHSELQSMFSNVSWKRRIYYYLTEYYSLRYADGVVNASQYLQTFFRRRSKRMLRPRLPMLYLPYAYNKEVCRVDTGLARQRFEKSPNHRYFVFMGSLVEDYGAFTMLEAFEEIARQRTDLKLLLLGRGRDYYRVRDYIEQHQLRKVVRMMGYIAEEDIPVYFSLADAFLLPLNDTVKDKARCPSKLYMYLPYKKPVVTCKVGEPYAVLGEKGTYFTPSDSHALAQTILHMAEHEDWTLDIDPEQHEWKARAQQLDEWVRPMLKNRQR